MNILKTKKCWGIIVTEVNGEAFFDALPFHGTREDARREAKMYREDGYKTKVVRALITYTEISQQ